MKILYVDWNSLCATDVKEAFKNLGHEILTINTPQENIFERNQEYSEKVEQGIKEFRPDIVFSMNFFPSVAMACEEMCTKYVSWIYDNPQTGAYDESVRGKYNYVFTYDSFMVNQLKSRGGEHIYYLPMAVNVKRVSRIKISGQDQKEYQCDVAFVGSLYNEGTDYYSYMLAKANNEYFRGYLEAVLNAQSLVYGYNFMAETLSPEIKEQFRKVGGFLLPEQSLLTEEEVYADVFLSRKLATINRVKLLYTLGEYFDVHFFTYQESPIHNITHRKPVSYEEEMPKVFKVAKINLNDTRRSNKNGIPLRAMDIMGCGGFLLSNYQEDFYKHFEPGVHMDMYGSLEEAVDKCNYYLKHDSEREKIKSNAFEIMSKEHTYEIRLQEMLGIVEKEI